MKIRITYCSKENNNETYCFFIGLFICALFLVKAQISTDEEPMSFREIAHLPASRYRRILGSCLRWI